MPNALEGRAIGMAHHGEQLVARPSDAGETISGAFIRGLLTGAFGTVHWRGVRLRGVTIDGDLDLSYCEWRGHLSLVNCTIRGDIDLSYARGTGLIRLDGSTMRSVTALNADLTGSLQLRNATVTAGLRAVGMRLAGALNLSDSLFVAPPAYENRPAVSLYRAVVDDVYLTRGTFLGGLYLNGVTVRRNLRLSGIEARSRTALRLRTGADTGGPQAVSAVGAEVGGAIYLFSESLRTAPPVLAGSLDLTRVRCSTLQARPRDVEGLTLTVDGLRFDRLRGMSTADWLGVLDGTTGTATEPYRHLAALSEAAGHFTEARDIRIALQRRIDATTPGPCRRRVTRWILRHTIAYGYRTGYAVAGLLAVSALAAVVLVLFDDYMVRELAGRPAERGFPEPEDAVAFAADSLLPFARLGATSAWSADPSNAWQVLSMGLFVALKGVAWALAALALAATTGLARKD